MSGDMTASLRCLPFSPAAAPPLEDDDLLSEILLRLPPLPSSLPRAAAVSRRWRGLVSDPRFSRRYRIRHRRNPPLLGCFIEEPAGVRFQPIMEAPNRVPEGCFPFPIDGGVPLGCRHGLMLTIHFSRRQLLVWDPITGDQRRLDIPAAFKTRNAMINGAVLRAAGAGDVHHFKFQVVLVGNNKVQPKQALASVYSSETSLWGNLITGPLLAEVDTGVYGARPAVMIGNSLYWVVVGDPFGILEFDFDRQSLCLIDMPREVTLSSRISYSYTVVLPVGGGLGFLFLSRGNAQLWKRKTNCDGVASWVVGKTIVLDTDTKRGAPFIVVWAEQNNVVVVLKETSIGIFTIQLEPLQLMKVSCLPGMCYPLEGVFTAEMGVGGAPGGADDLNNA